MVSYSLCKVGNNGSRFVCFDKVIIFSFAYCYFQGEKTYKRNMNEYLKYNKNNQYDKKLSNYNDELVLELWDVNEIRNDVRFYKGFSNEKYDTKKCITDIEVQIVKRLKEVCENNEILEKCVPKVKRSINNGTGGDDDSKRKVRRFLKRRSQPRSNTKNKTNINNNNDKINLFLGDEKNCNVNNINSSSNNSNVKNGKPMLKQSTTSPNLFTSLNRKDTKQDSIVKYHQLKGDMEVIKEHRKKPPMLKDLVNKDNYNNYNHLTSTGVHSNNNSLRDIKKHTDINSKTISNTHINKPKFFHKGSLLLLTRNHSFLSNNDIMQTSINKRNNSINICSYKTTNTNTNNTLFHSYSSNNNKLHLNIITNTNNNSNSNDKITKNISSSSYASSTSKTEIPIINPNKQYNTNIIKKPKFKKHIPLPLPKNFNTKINKTLNKSLLLHKNILSRSNSYSYYTSHKVFIDNYNYKLQARTKNNSMDNINILLPLEKIPKKYFIYKYGHFVSTNPKYQDFLYNCNFISKVTPTNSFKFKKAIGEQVLKMRVKKRRFGSIRFYKFDTTDDYDKGHNKYKSIKQGKNRKKELFDEIIRKTELNGNKLKKLSFN